ncbi:alpha/beta fold hydrolase [Nocardia blacklockiae]|uniref:alpha/beta fold hydrolase n=1 Tax=Nocardia blacklockiae TaxID=480036 RepID=UPI00189415EB|nr:alpha/beta hydrolase [Nocardia blacklockiae]MBF6175354.1 alpha/beta hydrolase [Nocardia blacklockiae]
MPIASIFTAVAERRATVRTSDGVELAVVETGPRTADLTVVLVHGHCLSTESWIYVREELSRRYPGARLVCYDHRGHGESAAAPRRTYHLEQLGRDLRDVLDAVAPTGPIVLVGHSMGGMTVLTYLSRNPAEIGSRVTGVALLATAAGNLVDAGFGRLLQNPIITLFQAAVRCAPRLMQRAKLLACKVFAPVVRAAEFGVVAVNPRVLALANAMRNRTSIVTMASFLSSFLAYDETASLPALSAIPTLVLCGSADLMTPASHSIALAAAVDYADLVLIPGAGHSVILEQPAHVADALTRLLHRAAEPAEPTNHLALAA